MYKVVKVYNDRSVADKLLCENFTDRTFAFEVSDYFNETWTLDDCHYGVFSQNYELKTGASENV